MKRYIQPLLMLAVTSAVCHLSHNPIWDQLRLLYSSIVLGPVSGKILSLETDFKFTNRFGTPCFFHAYDP